MKVQPVPTIPSGEDVRHIRRDDHHDHPDEQSSDSSDQNKPTDTGSAGMSLAELMDPLPMVVTVAPETVSKSVAAATYQAMSNSIKSSPSDTSGNNSKN